MSIETIKSDFKKLANPVIAAHSQRFFKTGKGEYGEGDIFLGIRVPVIRELVRKYKKVPLADFIVFLKSGYHEERLFALLSLVYRFDRGTEKDQQICYDLYLENVKYINNWDLVDLTASQIVGRFLENRDKKLLYDFANSENLWKRRISIIASFYFIRKRSFDDTLNLATILLNDKEDLIHKAVGWMLREVGKRDLEIEERFLEPRYKDLPRTMLRYAIEKFPEEKRQAYLKGEI